MTLGESPCQSSALHPWCDPRLLKHEVEVVTRADDDEEDEFVDEPNWEGGTELGSPVASSDDDVDDDDAAGEGEGEGEGEGGEE